MRRGARAIVFVVFACSSNDAPSSEASSGSSGGSSSSGSTSSGGPPPAGDGIAARYPGDVGIGNDPDVVFADDFESYGQTNDLWKRWSNVFQVVRTRIATEPANVHAG